MKTVLSKRLILTPDNEKTNLPLGFLIDEQVSKIIITYSYSPKELGESERARLLIEENLRKDTHGDRELYPCWKEFLPLKNLVTLSLDSPEGYVGAAHRQDSHQQHIISAELSSRGFTKAVIIPGKWTLTLNVHALVTEKCECEVRVEAGGADDE